MCLGSFCHLFRVLGPTWCLRSFLNVFFGSLFGACFSDSSVKGRLLHLDRETSKELVPLVTKHLRSSFAMSFWCWLKQKKHLKKKQKKLLRRSQEVLELLPYPGSNATRLFGPPPWRVFRSRGVSVGCSGSGRKELL